MEENLTIFENQNLEILLKEDVTFDFNGDVLFNGKQVAKILEYGLSADNEKKLNDSLGKAIRNHVDDECKYLVVSSCLATNTVVSLEQRGSIFVNEDGVMDLIYNSKMEKAKEFKKKIRNIIKEVQKTGRFDSVEQNIKLIKDETERGLKLKIYQLENIIKVNPNDMLTILNYNQTKNDLANYINKKEIEDVKNDFNKLKGEINKTTALREGDKDAKAVARYFNVFSKTNKPHNQFADKLAKVLGFFVKPDGNAGYQDSYITINLSSVGGTTVSEAKYSTKAVELMEEYIKTNGLEIDEPPKYGKRGENKGKFQEAKMLFENGEHIFINEITYNYYSQIVNKGI